MHLWIGIVLSFLSQQPNLKESGYITRERVWYTPITCPSFSLSFTNILRLIKLTSPNLNYIIGAGAILLYLAIYVGAVPTTDRTVVKWLCNVSAHFV